MTRFKTILIITAMTAVILATSATCSAAPPGHAFISTRWFQPLLELPRTDLTRAECVMHEESHSTFTHPNLGDDNANPGQSGIFQMSNTVGGVWDHYVLPVLHVLIWKASAYQQAEGFVIVVRVDGFEPWHQYDGC